MTDISDTITVCLHQFIRPDKVTQARAYNGNCTECKYDPANNNKCNGYYPISVTNYEVIQQH